MVSNGKGGGGVVIRKVKTKPGKQGHFQETFPSTLKNGIVLQKCKYTILTIITCTFLQLTPYMMDNLDSMDDPDIQKEISAGSQNYI